MSTRFEKKIIMPAGKMGRTTLMDLSKEDLASVERWHKKEWNQFIEEITAYKQKILDASRDAYLWNRENCVACKKMREFKSKYRQQGSILLGAAGTVKHAAGGDFDCTFTASTVGSLFDFCIPTCVARCRARLFSDGDWYWSEGTTSWLTAKGTWQGDCAVADYDTRWNKTSGDAPNEVVSGSDGVYSAATTSKAVGYSENLGSLTGNFSFNCRDGTSLTLLFTDTFSMNAEATP